MPNQQQSKPRIQLPTAKTPASNRFEDYTILLYGRPNIGKAAFAASAPNALFIETDAGLESFEIARVSVKTWREFFELLIILEKEDHKYSPLVLYTVDSLQALCSEYIYNKFNIKHESDLTHGKGWHILQKEFARGIRKLRMLKLGLIVVSHSKEKKKVIRGRELMVQVPSLTGSYAEKIVSQAEIAIYCEAELQRDSKGNIIKENDIPVYRRVGKLDSSIEYEAGDRTRRLNGTLPLNYMKFKESWENSTPIDPTTI